MLRSILFLQLGGSRVASLAHRTLGLPGVSTVRQNSLVTPLIASAGTLTKAQIQRNIQLAFENADVTGSYGYVLMIDEIAIEQRTRWDPTNNSILGVCREHSAHINLDFCSINDVKILFREILEGKSHYAKEVRELILMDRSVNNSFPGNNIFHRNIIQQSTCCWIPTFYCIWDLQARGWRDTC